MKLIATCVTCRIQDGIAMLGFADNEYDPTQYVILQKELIPGQKDLDCELDQVHIEINSQLCSAYGGVMEAIVHNNKILLKLTPQAAAGMSVDSNIEIATHVSKECLKEIVHQLCLMIGHERVHIVIHE